MVALVVASILIMLVTALMWAFEEWERMRDRVTETEREEGE